MNATIVVIIVVYIHRTVQVITVTKQSTIPNNVSVSDLVQVHAVWIPLAEKGCTIVAIRKNVKIVL